MKINVGSSRGRRSVQYTWHAGQKGPTQIPPKNSSRKSRQAAATPSVNLEDMEAMTKEELIEELIKARIAEARLKKGYEVKGDGSVIRYVSKNTK